MQDKQAGQQMYSWRRRTMSLRSECSSLRLRCPRIIRHSIWSLYINLRRPTERTQSRSTYWRACPHHILKPTTHIEGWSRKVLGKLWYLCLRSRTTYNTISNYQLCIIFDSGTSMETSIWTTKDRIRQRILHKRRYDLFQHFWISS